MPHYIFTEIPQKCENTAKSTIKDQNATGAPVRNVAICLQ